MAQIYVLSRNWQEVVKGLLNYLQRYSLFLLKVTSEKNLADCIIISSFGGFTGFTFDCLPAIF